MTKISRVILLLLWSSIAFSLPPETVPHAAVKDKAEGHEASAIERDRTVEEAPKTETDANIDDSYRTKVGWNKPDKFVYSDDSGKWHFPAEYQIASAEGTKPQGTKKLVYKKGDILFRVGDGATAAWYKADANEFPKPKRRSEAPEYKDLPEKIKHFIDVYAEQRPNMKFDLRIYKVAQARALQGHAGHVWNINRLIWDAGFRTPDVNANSNTSESLWGGPDMSAEQALDGWRGHGPHAVHVFGQDATYAAHEYYGVGYNPANGQWAIVTSRPEMK